MDLYIFPLTDSETKNPLNLGWVYAKKNEDRWVQYNDMLKEHFVDPDYSREVTYIVYNDIVYDVYKNYIDIAANKRVWIIKPSGRSSDVIVNKN